jgi:predicted nucleic acid-binding protein
VLDTSVAVAWILEDEPLRPSALALAESIRVGALDPMVASNFGFELCFSLVRAARRRRIEWDDVRPVLDGIDLLTLEVPPIDYPDGQLLELCRTVQISWANAHHAWLARETGRPLVTADRRLARSLERSEIWVSYLGDQPAGLQPGQGDRDQDVEQQPESQ